MSGIIFWKERYPFICVYIYIYVYIPYIPWYAVYFGHVLFQHDLRIRSAEVMNVESFRLKDPLEWTVSEVGDFLASILQGDPRGPKETWGPGRVQPG